MLKTSTTKPKQTPARAASAAAISQSQMEVRGANVALSAQLFPDRADDAICYDESRHGSIAAFKAHADYPRFAEQFNARLDELQAFVLEHFPEDDTHHPYLIWDCIREFGERVLGEHFGAPETAMGAGKRSFDALCRLLHDDDILPELRTSHVLKLARELGGNDLSAAKSLANSSLQMSLAAFPITQTTLSARNKLIDDAARRGISKGGPELEKVYLRAIRQELANDFQIDHTEDGFDSSPAENQSAEVCPSELRETIKEQLRPARLAIWIAKNALSSFSGKLAANLRRREVDLTDGFDYADGLSAIDDARMPLELTLGNSIDPASLIEFADDGTIGKLRTDPSLLAVDILRAQAKAQLLDPTHTASALHSWRQEHDGAASEIKVMHFDGTLFWAERDGVKEHVQVSHLREIDAIEQRHGRWLQEVTSPLRSAVVTQFIPHASKMSLKDLSPAWLTSLDAIRTLHDRLTPKAFHNYAFNNEHRLTEEQIVQFEKVSSWRRTRK